MYYKPRRKEDAFINLQRMRIFLSNLQNFNPNSSIRSFYEIRKENFLPFLHHL